MKFFKKVVKNTVALALAFYFMVPSSLNIVHAQEAEPAADYSLDETFVPFRDQIPDYIARHSSYKGELIKKLWGKIFYEELNWNKAASQDTNNYFYDAKYSSWWAKYNHGYDSETGAKVPIYYTGLGGVQKQLNSQITYSTGDFEAYFGNTLEANPEFLGQMLGLDGYSPLGSDKGNALMQEVMVTYLKSPEKYTYLTQSICNLTKNKMYIGDSKTASNNLLKDKSYGEYSLDIYVLTCLASLYEGDGSETYLSTDQVTWLKSYQEYLYNDYISKGASSLAKKYAPIYDLIARSTYAANGTKIQEFFDYVEASGVGAGAWLNLNKNINIAGLEAYPTITPIFEAAQGWCGGLHNTSAASEKCGNRTNCTSKATDVDKIAYQLYKSNATAKAILTANTTVNKAISGGTTTGYITKFNAKHAGTGVSGTYSKQIRAGNDISRHAYATTAGGRYNAAHVWADSSTTASNSCGVGTDDPNGDVDPITGSDTLIINSTAFASPNTLIIMSETVDQTFYFQPEWDNCRRAIDKWEVRVGGNVIASRNNETLVQCVNVNGHYAFKIGSLTPTQRAKAELRVTYRAVAHAYHNVNMVDYTPAYNADASFTASGLVTVQGTYPACATSGHKWACSEDTNTIIWSNDYSKVKFMPYCTACGETATERVINTTVTTEGNYFVYTAFDPYENLTVTKRVNKNTGATSEYITLNSSNAGGTLSHTDYGEVRKYPGGGASEESYKESDTILNATVKSGVLKAGTRQVVVDYEAAEDCLDLIIEVYNSRGQLIGKNASTFAETISNRYRKKYTSYNKAHIIAGTTDADLVDAYVVIKVHANTIRVTPSRRPDAPLPDRVYSSAEIKGITLIY